MGLADWMKAVTSAVAAVITELTQFHLPETYAAAWDDSLPLFNKSSETRGRVAQWRSSELNSTPDVRSPFIQECIAASASCTKLSRMIFHLIYLS